MPRNRPIDHYFITSDKEPTREGHRLRGWAHRKDATFPDFDLRTVIEADMTVYAVWDPLPKLNVTFDPNDGSGKSRVVDVLEGKPLGPKFPQPPPPRKDHDFIGWSTKPGATKPDFTPETKVKKSVRVFGVWKRHTVPVTFEPNGGQGGPIVVNVPKGDPLDGHFPTPPPVWPGHTLVGWSTDPAATTPNITKDTKVTVPTRVFAVWKVKPKVPVTFEPNGGEGGPIVVDVPKGDPLDGLLPQPPVRRDHSFVGWSKDPAATVPDVTKDTKVTDPTKVFAVWKKKPLVKVTFDPNGGEGAPTEVDVPKGEALNDRFPSTPPRRAGHILVGWSTEPRGASPNFKRDTKVAKSLRVYAVWKATVTVTYDSNSDGGPTTVEVPKGEPMGEKFPKPLQRRGFDFLGWSTKGAQGPVDFTKDTKVMRSLRIYGVWKKKPTVMVFFKPRGSEKPRKYLPPFKVDVPMGEAMEELFPADPTLEGLKFTGYWYCNEASPRKCVKEKFTRDMKITKNLTVWGVWYFVVTFDANGGKGAPQEVEARQIQPMEERFPTAQPTRDGYDFLGWATSRTATTPDFTKDTKVMASQTLYAVWRLQPGAGFTISFKQPKNAKVEVLDLSTDPTRTIPIADGAKVAPGTKIQVKVTVDAGHRLAELRVNDEPQRNLHTVIVERNLGISVLVEKEKPGATPKPARHEVSFELDGGKLDGKDAVDSQMVADGGVATDPGVPTKEGYEFEGWFNGAARYEFGAKVAGRLVLVARWKALPSVSPKSAPHEVSFELDGGKLDGKDAVDSQMVADGGVATDPGAPTKEGYEFEGWFNGAARYEFGAKVAGRLVLVARWKALPSASPKPARHEVSFELDGGKLNGKDAVDSQMVADGGMATDPGAPTKEGYEFEGWFNGAARYEFGAKVAGRLVLVARWKALPSVSPKPARHEVSFELDGGKLDGKDAVDSQMVADGGVATDPGVPTKEGYEFEGWFNGAARYEFGAKVMGSMTLTAKWVRKGDANPEVGNSDALPDTSTPVEAASLARLSVFPNPAVDFIVVEGLTERTMVHLYTLLGEPLRSETLAPGARVDISKLRTGVYLLKIEGQVLRFTKR